MKKYLECVTLDASVCIWLALLVLTVPLPWLCAMSAAGLVHELGHIAAVRLLGGEIGGISVGSRGACIQASAMSPKRKILCSLAGPACSLLLVLLIRVCPRVSICGFAQGIFNLLPFDNLDGGHIIQAMQERRLGREKVSLQIVH